jgi:hypothetical protein
MHLEGQTYVIINKDLLMDDILKLDSKFMLGKISQSDYINEVKELEK